MEECYFKGNRKIANGKWQQIFFNLKLIYILYLNIEIIVIEYTLLQGIHIITLPPEIRRSIQKIIQTAVDSSRSKRGKTITR